MVIVVLYLVVVWLICCVVCVGLLVLIRFGLFRCDFVLCYVWVLRLLLV